MAEHICVHCGRSFTDEAEARFLELKQETEKESQLLEKFNQETGWGEKISKTSKYLLASIYGGLILGIVGLLLDFIYFSPDIIPTSYHAHKHAMDLLMVVFLWMTAILLIVGMYWNKILKLRRVEFNHWKLKRGN